MTASGTRDEPATRPGIAPQPGPLWIFVPFAVALVGSCANGMESSAWLTFGGAGRVLRLAGVLWAVAWGVYAWRLRGVARTRGQYAIALLVFGGVLAWASAVVTTAAFGWINCALDDSPPAARRATVVRAEEREGTGGPRWFVWVDETPGGHGRARVRVNREAFARARPGEGVVVTTHRGRLGMEWCRLAAHGADACLAGFAPRAP